MDGIVLNVGVANIVLSVTLALTAYVLYLWLFNKPPNNLPPGPTGWKTFVAIVKALKNETLHELAAVWARKYGPITYLNVMGQSLVIINNADLGRRILGSDKTKNALADRIPITASKIAGYNGKDPIFMLYDALAKKKRKIFHYAISLFGDGVERFENVVYQEMDRLFEELKQFENQDINLSRYISRSLKIVLYILALGETPDDVTKPDILEEFDIAFNKLWASDHEFVITNMPILAKLPGRYKNAIDRLRVATKAAEELVYFSPRRTWTPGQPRGIADLLFDLEGKPGNEWMQKDPEHNIAFLTSLFLAAHLTSRASLNGGFLCLLNNPKVARKIQDEIDTVIGDRRPTVGDRQVMPYTDATILEALRFITQIPLSAPRITSEDIHIDGVTIPKKTHFFLNTGFFHRDEEIWEDSWSFKPERFLDGSGQLLPLDSPIRKNLLPFGFGLRSCPGEVFAKSRVFMFFTSILQKYDILPPENEKLVPADFHFNHETVKGFIRQTRPYKCRLRPRKIGTANGLLH
jgi:steroid 17alpha-monooxygenase/17alpha-hydroxyprogesterone aldolase